MARRVFDRVIHIILASLFPLTCYGCGIKGTRACDICLEKASIERGRCFFCKNRPAEVGICMLCIKQYPIDGVIWAYSFRAPVIRKVIHDLKYRKRLDDMAKLAPRLEKAIAREELPIDTAHVAIPLHPKREQERGFNQAELIALSLGFSAREKILSRIKETPPQARTISRKDRFLHIQGAFAVIERAACAGKDFLLIDDVATTGATITEAARTLKENGARNVYAAVLAH